MAQSKKKSFTKSFAMMVWFCAVVSESHATVIHCQLQKSVQNQVKKERMKWTIVGEFNNLGHGKDFAKKSVQFFEVDIAECGKDLQNE